MSKLEAILKGSVAPGVYRFTSQASPETLMREACAHDWRLFYLDGHTITSKATFLAACRAALDLPGYCGDNWDALEECVNDLAWAPASGYVILYDQVANFARRDPDSWAIALDILDTAVSNWSKSGTPLHVLLRNTARLTSEIAEAP